MTITTKPIVHYDSEQDYFINVGGRAFVHPIDHPDVQYVTNTTHVITSYVKVYDEKTGIFETENTIYRPWRIK